MESTFDNSEEIISKETLLIEESIFINKIKGLTIADFLSNTIIDGTNEIIFFINQSRNSLIKCLGSIKQNYEYFSNIKDSLDNIIRKIENLILLSYKTSYSDEKSKMKEGLKCLTGIFELFIILFQLTTNNSFLESFFNMFLKFLKRGGKLSMATQNTIIKHYSQHYAKIYNILIDKKIDYIDKLRDSKLSVKVVKIISQLLDKLDNDTYTEEIKILDLFNFLLTAKNNLFALSNDIFLDRISALIFNIFKKIFENIKKELLPFNHKEEIYSVSEIILAKMLEIAKYKDDLKNSINYSQEIFYVNTLILCLRMIKLILQSNPDLLLLNQAIQEKLTRVIIELTFWDSYLIVDYTCKLFELLWKQSLQKDTAMRSGFQKIIEYMFLRRYQTYYSYLGDTEDANIKLSVIEIITKYLNKLIDNSDFLITCYINYDFSKIRFNLVCEIFISLQQYYTLNNSRFNYIKKLITFTYLNAFNSVMKGISHDVGHNPEFLKTYQSVSDTWLEVVKLVNAGKFKKFNEKITQMFNLKFLDKKSDLAKEDETTREEYRRICKSIANLIKYSYMIDINIVYETISDNNAFSEMILEEYCNTFDFRGLEILRAYEVYVSTFKLYGEPHNIYNFLMQFSKKYFADNYGVQGSPFVREDQVTTLAYSILMLNTDLHNPNLTKHMTNEEFIKNNHSTKLFDDFPVDYFRNIYKCISTDPLKVASSRLRDYSKSEDVFMVLRSMRYNYDMHRDCKHKETSKIVSCNVLTHICQYEEEESCFNSTDFPLINLFEDFSLKPHSKLNKNLRSVYLLLWEDLFYNFMSMPYKFYEVKDDNSLRVLEKVCHISQKLDQKENIDKLIMTLHSIINSGNFDKRNIVQLYNLFFYISINFSKNFHTYLEIYYEAILNIISHKISGESQIDLKHNYNNLIDSIIDKTYAIIDAKRHKKSNNSGIFNYFFSRSAKPEVDFSQTQYGVYIYKNFRSIKDMSSTEAVKINEDYLIEITKILDLIKNQEEEFIFFVTLSASKILDFNTKSEFYYSLVFLNEILDSNLQEKEFYKIWQNLFNILKSKMEFKHIFDKEENLFDLLYCNYFLYEIIIRFCHIIEVEDYTQLLENYLEIENLDVLFFIMENNDRLITALKSQSQERILEKIFESNVNLVFKLIDHFSGQVVNHRNSHSLQKLLSSTIFFKNLIESVVDFSLLSVESLTFVYKIIKCFFAHNFVKLFSESLGDNTLLYNLIGVIFAKMIDSLSNINEEKWELFILILEFSLKSSLTENEEIQTKFMNLVLHLFNKTKIPLLKFKEISSLLNHHCNNFVGIKIKYENYWMDFFKLFFSVFSNNDELFSSHHDDIESLWNLFIRKVLISFVDYNKRINDSSKINQLENAKLELSKIFELANTKIKAMNERPSWWDSTKNTVRLYFPDLIKE